MDCATARVTSAMVSSSTMFLASSANWSPSLRNDRPAWVTSSQNWPRTVSYTHLTLPTICSV
eukprot:3517820-Alexandrium_andersonii.AAC.1